MSVTGNTTFANREVCDLTILDYATQKPILYFPYANTNSTELTSSTVYAYGGKGRPARVGFNGEKGGTFTIETQMQSFQLYSFITGGNLQSNAKLIKREELKANSDGKLTLSDTPVAGTVNVFAAVDDCGTPVACTVSDKEVSGDGVTADADYIVYYVREITSGVQRINIKSTTFPKAVTIYADTYDKTEDEEILPYHLVVYKGQPEANIQLSNSNEGDPSSITITVQLMADKDHNMIDMVLLDEEDE